MGRSKKDGDSAGKKPRKPFNLVQRTKSKLRELWRESDEYHNAYNAAKVEVFLSRNNGMMEFRYTKDDAPPFKVIPDDATLKAGRRVMFRCALCSRLFFDKSTYPKKDKPVKNMACDHVLPVVLPEEGFIDWNTFFQNLFHGELQILCNYPGEVDGQPSCHYVKTKAERDIRTLQCRAAKAAKKEKL
jgi:hypothetical protein